MYCARYEISFYLWYAESHKIGQVVGTHPPSIYLHYLLKICNISKADFGKDFLASYQKELFVAGLIFSVPKHLRKEIKSAIGRLDLRVKYTDPEKSAVKQQMQTCLGINLHNLQEKKYPVKSFRGRRVFLNLFVITYKHTI